MYSYYGRKKMITIRLLFFESYRRYLKGAGSVTISKHVTHYRPMSGLLYYNVRTPHPPYLERASSITHMGTGRTALRTITSTQETANYDICMSKNRYTDVL